MTPEVQAKLNMVMDAMEAAFGKVPIIIMVEAEGEMSVGSNITYGSIGLLFRAAADVADANQLWEEEKP